MITTRAPDGANKGIWRQYSTRYFPILESSPSESARYLPEVGRERIEESKIRVEQSWDWKYQIQSLPGLRTAGTISISITHPQVSKQERKAFKILAVMLACCICPYMYKVRGGDRRWWTWSGQGGGLKANQTLTGISKIPEIPGLFGIPGICLERGQFHNFCNVSFVNWHSRKLQPQF